MKKTNISGLNGLRGLAAFIVVISHFAGATKTGDGFLQAGKLGVMIFFALSGFLMAFLYLSEDRRIGAINVWNYIVRRFSRVFPLFLLVVVTSFAAVTFGTKRISQVAFNIDSDNIISHIFLQKGISVLWTIPVEFAFYAFFILPMAMWKTSRDFA